MARKDEFHEIHTHCVMCGELMPLDRPRMAITCSDACKVKRRNYRRSRQDARMCRYCFKPSTPEQRLAFQQWRRRPQNAEEEEQFRFWRIAQTSAAQLKSRRENKRKKLAETDGVELEPQQEDNHADTGAD